MAFEELPGRGAAVVGVEPGRCKQWPSPSTSITCRISASNPTPSKEPSPARPRSQHALEHQAVTGGGKNRPRNTRPRRTEHAIARHEHLAIPAGEEAAAPVLEHERRRQQGLGGLPVPGRECLSPKVIDPRRGVRRDAERIRAQLGEARERGVAVARSFGTLPEGGPFETYYLAVETVARGRVTRLELFELEAVDAPRGDLTECPSDVERPAFSSYAPSP
jgi:hypothetical protein